MSDNFKKIYEESINNPENFWKNASKDISIPSKISCPITIKNNKIENAISVALIATLVFLLCQIS